MHRRFKRNNSSDSPLPMREDDDMDQNSFSVKILIFLVLALVGVFFVIRARSPGNIDDDGDFDSPYMLLLDAGETKSITQSIMWCSCSNGTMPQLEECCTNCITI